MKLDGNVYFTAGGKHQFCNLKEEKKKKKNLFAKDDTQRQKDRE